MSKCVVGICESFGDEGYSALIAFSVKEGIEIMAVAGVLLQAVSVGTAIVIGGLKEYDVDYSGNGHELHLRKKINVDEYEFLK